MSKAGFNPNISRYNEIQCTKRCRGFDSLNQCVHELAKSQVSKNILEKYDKNEIPVSGRSHPGGSCFSEKWDIENDKTIDLNSISQGCR